jgi:hypothetical protein
MSPAAVPTGMALRKRKNPPIARRVPLGYLLVLVLVTTVSATVASAIVATAVTTTVTTAIAATAATAATTVSAEVTTATTAEATASAAAEAAAISTTIATIAAVSTAITTTVSTAEATATAAAKATAITFGARTGLVHHQVATVEVLAVGAFDRRTTCIIVGHLHESEAAATVGGFVHDDLGRGHLSEGGEEVEEILVLH